MKSIHASAFAVLSASVLSIASFGAEATKKPAPPPEVMYPNLSFEKMKFNTPGTVELGCGYCSLAVPVDIDGDGDWDIAATGGGYGGGVRLYEGTGDPFHFKAEAKVPGAEAYPWRSFSLLPDGRYALTGAGNTIYGRLGEKPGEPVKHGWGCCHWTRVRANSWLTRDFDGDGREDLINGIGDWTKYGWDNKYDARRQAWTNSNCRGLLYLVRNLGEVNGRTKWSDIRLIRIEDGQPIETMSNPQPMLEDWDGDGDLDFILSDFPGSFTYFENIGTRTKPVYTSGRLLHDSKGALLASPECIPKSHAIDWDRDGKIDILSAQEDSRISFHRNTGRIAKGMPVFEPAVFLRSDRVYLHFGILTSPYVCDFDGDGDQDIVVGDSAGYLAWFENVSGPKVAEPKWEGPHYLECAEPTDDYVDITVRPDTLQCKPFKHRAGYNGSIQGPIEAGFGYTCESVADWDGDGDLDIIYNHIWGKPMLLENIGTRTKPRFAAPHGIKVEWGKGGQPELKWPWFTPKSTGNPDEIVTQWRTTPVMVDMNGDGLMDLVMSDTEGYLAYFERYRENGVLKLKAPRRAFLDAKNGRPMGVTGWGEGLGGGKGGNSGRRKICLADWDGDGKLDLIMNGKLNAVLWTQVEAKDGTWSFKRHSDMTTQKIQSHSTCPAPCDFDGDGITDLLLGSEDGYIYFLRNPRSAAK